MAEPVIEQRTSDLLRANGEQAPQQIAEPPLITAIQPKSSDKGRIQGGVTSKEYLKTMRELRAERGAFVNDGILEHSDSQTPLVQGPVSANNNNSKRESLLGFFRKRR